MRMSRLRTILGRRHWSSNVLSVYFQRFVKSLIVFYYLCLNEGPGRHECFILIPSFSPLTYVYVIDNVGLSQGNFGGRSAVIRRPVRSYVIGSMRRAPQWGSCAARPLQGPERPARHAERQEVRMRGF